MGKTLQIIVGILTLIQIGWGAAVASGASAPKLCSSSSRAKLQSARLLGLGV